MEAAIRALESAYDAAWNAGDLPTLFAIFADDATIVNPLGSFVQGRPEIERMFGDFFADRLRGSRHTSVITRVFFPTPDVAIADGEATLNLAPSAGASRLVHPFTDVFVRRADQWVLLHVRAYVFMPSLP